MPAPPDTLKKGQAFLARGGLDGLLPLPGKGGDVRRAESKSQSLFLREPFDKARIRLSLTTAQTVLEMADGQFAITLGKQPVQENDRVAPAGDADEIAPIVRQVPR